MTSPPQNTRADIDAAVQQLTEDQRAYEALFGLVPEWHAAADESGSDQTELDDDALYRSLFGDDAA